MELEIATNKRGMQALLHWSLLALLPVVFITTLTAQRRPSPKIVVLAHVTVVDLRSGQLHQNQSVVIEAERIAVVGESGAVVVPRGALVINASGKYLIPGLWDAHVHLSYLGACALPVFVANGVTSVRDCGARQEDTAIWQKQIAEGKLIGPRIKT